MFRATVETDIGDRLRLLRPDGRTGGHAVLSLIMGIATYCSNGSSQDELMSWFSELEEKAQEPICEFTQVLLTSFYSGEWDYKEDEYEWFHHRSPDDHLTEEEFRQTIQEVLQKWVDARRLLKTISDLLTLLEAQEPEAQWWYEPRATEADLRTLSETLLLAIKRQARQVRIQFS